MQFHFKHRFHFLIQFIKKQISVMSPAYFALTMATGIVAISAHHHGLKELSLALSLINRVAFPILLALLFLRVFMFPLKVLEDASNHKIAHGFFTVVAAMSVVGSEFVILDQKTEIGISLWWGAIILWGIFTYLIFSALTIKKNKPLFADGINGGWLVAVVSTQSIVVLGCVLNGEVFENRDIGLFALISFWLFGGMLYLWIIALIFYRYMFYSFSPRDLMPPYWINMGSVAISTLAGVLLYRCLDSSDLLQPLRPFVLGVTIAFWATATWWIPMLFILGVWRHCIHKIKISYDPLYWGLVFPFGMYSVCTFQLASVVGLSFLFVISKISITVALVSWILAFLGVIGRLVLTPYGVRRFALQRK